MPTDLRWRRVLLKLSGEALTGTEGFGIAPTTVARIADEIGEVVALGGQLAPLFAPGLQAVRRGDLGGPGQTERQVVIHGQNAALPTDAPPSINRVWPVM